MTSALGQVYPNIKDSNIHYICLTYFGTSKEISISLFNKLGRRISFETINNLGNSIKNNNSNNLGKYNQTNNSKVDKNSHSAVNKLNCKDCVKIGKTNRNFPEHIKQLVVNFLLFIFEFQCNQETAKRASYFVLYC